MQRGGLLDSKGVEIEMLLEKMEKMIEMKNLFLDLLNNRIGNGGLSSFPKMIPCLSLIATILIVLSWIALRGQRPDDLHLSPLKHSKVTTKAIYLSIFIFLVHDYIFK